MNLSTINTNYSTYTNQIQNISNSQKTEETSFASILEDKENTQQTVEKEEGLYLKYMDQFNYFDSLSQEDRKVFREILKDDKITREEIDSLSYEQAEKLEYYFMPHGDFSNEQINNTPIVHTSNQIRAMLSVTQTTNDKTFNEALYRTAGEIDDDGMRMIILGQVDMNISQALFGYELLPSFIAGAQTKNQWDWDYENMNIDYDKFLNDVISMHKKEIANPPNNDPEYIKQHQERLDGYNIILKHYNEIKNEKLNIQV